jgi:hypothetical protein
MESNQTTFAKIKFKSPESGKARQAFWLSRFIAAIRINIEEPI